MTKNVEQPIKYNKNDVEIISKRKLFNGFFQMIEYRFRHRLFEGGWSEEITLEVFERGHAGVILPYDPEADKVVLIEQIRLPAIETSQTPWLLEAVAGMIETDETAEQVVRREADEEAGLVIGRTEKALSYLSSPGGTSERMYVYVGEVDSSHASGIHGLKSENEDIRVHVVSREQAYQWVEEGIIDNAATVIVLQWLQLNYKKLQQKWVKLS
ncbi:ADP-ribose diphosphatase [Providencia stuartii]|uniref:ADP-ribose pyrophosphatase n=1 Tax=Providencia stuartii (strain MRSN 2154) TaxID=1157951 RepID=A0A140NMR1_PROSM|nr:MULTISPECIES: ADP-ribose diphosphatase [Providencia]AFH94749.1 ADP-ribose pyrophosphatase NudF [Providencia stuartii MRSN 2154]MDE8746071.1 ADP-ribose diphosphatase [Providencia thailandensis]MDE8766943.1 ADP-ribose diphosphatase [Providencia thailandensis]MDE8779249.1 ADP-ribose diphosphatase [Providencia thailandensis]MDE8783217.1 ADP-ribose diphosphatase [Providencia thailandensis]